MNNTNYVKMLGGRVTTYKELVKRFRNGIDKNTLNASVYNMIDDIVLAAVDEYLSGDDDRYLPGMTCSYDDYINANRSVANATIDQEVDENMLLPLQVDKSAMERGRITEDEWITF